MGESDSSTRFEESSQCVISKLRQSLGARSVYNRRIIYKHMK